jgi:predicted enzyme related to lactoylglutathione lyase
MITQLVNASIWSEDLINLLPFYRDVLGMKTAMESPTFVVLGTDRPDVPVLALGTHSDVRGPNRDPARHMVALGTDDLESDWKRLKEAGVEFVEDPTKYGDEMWIATLKDPEGNLIQLFEMRGSQG